MVKLSKKKMAPRGKMGTQTSLLSDKPNDGIHTRHFATVPNIRKRLIYQIFWFIYYRANPVFVSFLFHHNVWNRIFFVMIVDRHNSQQNPCKPMDNLVFFTNHQFKLSHVIYNPLTHISFF